MAFGSEEATMGSWRKSAAWLPGSGHRLLSSSFLEGLGFRVQGLGFRGIHRP